jgi:caffeoyl-CoA O-methyltransferase
MRAEVPIMADIVDPELEAYALAHTTPPPDYLVALAEETRATLVAPGMMVGPLEGRYLQMLVFALRPRRVLEIGTFSGYSALSMAAGLAPGGRITTCEISPVHAEMARRHIASSPFGDVIDVIEGPALDTLAVLEGPFDFVFIDADKTNYAAYLAAVLPMLAPDGLIAIDNTLWSGQVIDDSDQSDDTKAIRLFNDALVGDERVVCVQTTVRDGVTLVRLA